VSAGSGRLDRHACTFSNSLRFASHSVRMWFLRVCAGFGAGAQGLGLRVWGPG
jgi:hypothetical protein